VGRAPVWLTGVVHYNDWWEYDSGSVVYHWFSAIGCRSGTRSADDSSTLVKLSKDRMEITPLGLFYLKDIIFDDM